MARERPNRRVSLDPEAFSQNAEYRRFLEGDYLGKLLFKSFLIHRAGVDPGAISIPLSRYGELDNRELADARVAVGGRDLSLEIKLARINIADSHRGGSARNWAYTNLLKTPAGEKKKYDIAVAIGVLTLGHEHPDYWTFERDELPEFFEGQGVSVDPEAMPHEPSYLSRCGLFVFDFDSISTNFFRINVRALDNSEKRKHFAWGHERERCKELWERAVKAAVS